MSTTIKPRHELWPTKYLEEKTATSEHTAVKTALIILNTPIAEFELLRRLYKHTAFRLCADGGANRLESLLTSHRQGPESEDLLRAYAPDLIHGDLDSLDDNVRMRYANIGVEISQDPDQYSTDFGKAVKKVLERLPEVENVLVLGSIGGRVDQGLGLLGELYREQTVRHPNVRFWLFSEASISTVLAPGHTTIHTPLKAGLIKRNIGILPLYGPAVITTVGLEWDIEDWPTEMGGQMSTSNHIVADEISVTTNTEVLFTVERVLVG